MTPCLVEPSTNVEGLKRNDSGLTLGFDFAIAEACFFSHVQQASSIQMAKLKNWFCQELSRTLGSDLVPEKRISC